MKISTRSRYGIRALLELAAHHGEDRPVLMKEIAERQDLSVKYLHAILTALKNAGIITSVHGSKGGFLLARDPAAITMDEIVTALDGPVCVVDCAPGGVPCGRQGICVTSPLWAEINQAITDILRSRTLADLLARGE